MPIAHRRVAILLPNGPAYFAQVFEGIGAYIRGRRHWQVVAWPSMNNPHPDLAMALAGEEVDGVIGQASPDWIDPVAAGKVAFVNAEFNRHAFPMLPRVGIDEAAVGRLAFEHFRERGFRHLATVGEARSLPAKLRVTAFREAAAEASAAPVHATAYAPPARFNAWLAALPLPVGIFCWNDETAKKVHQACHAVGLRIPEDVALLGMDNDSAICHFLDPELSSIDPNARRIGYECAAMLDRLMDGQPPPQRPLLIPPIGLVTRASTEMMAMHAPDVVRAIAYIRDHAGTAMTIEDVLDHLAISRRSLEKQFKAHLGRSPRSEIHRVLVDRARDLLANTDLAIPAVAERCGYPRANHFTTMFRKRTGMTPSQYRKQTKLMG